MRTVLILVIASTLTACDAPNFVSHWFRGSVGDRERSAALYERVQQHDVSAMAELKQLAENNDAYAAFFAGLALDPAVQLGPGDPSAAAAFYEMAGQEVPAAKHNLALLILRGVRRPGVTNETALQLLQDVAPGQLQSMLLLGTLYDRGWAEMASNPALAAQWFERAIEYSKDPRAELALGSAFQDGRGRPRDLGAATRLLTSAAKAGLPEAAYRLGAASSDAVQAAQWFVVAAAGDAVFEPRARDALSKLEAGDQAQVRSNALLWLRAHERSHSTAAIVAAITEP